MVNPIKFDELFDRQGIKAGFDALKSELKKAEKDLIASAKNIKKATEGIKLTDKDAATQLDKNKIAVQKLRKEVDLNRKAQDQLTVAQNKLRISQSNVGIETAKVRDAIQRQNRITKEQITLNRATQGSMTALSVELGRNRQKYRDLSAAQRANASVGGKLLTTIQQQDTEIKRLDETIGNAQRKVGGYAAAILEAEKKLRGQETALKQNIRALKIAAAQTGNNTTQQKRIQAELVNTGKKYRQVVSELKQYNKGQERSSKATRQLTRLLGAFGLAGGITLVVRGFKEMIGIFSGFEKQAAKVRAISGATDEEFKRLTDDAKRLGESTEKTATNVGELQLALAKLGFTTDQIIAATEGILDLSTAIDEDLAESARVVANTLRGFNLGAEETARVTDVMALAISSSALDLTKFSVAMSKVAPVAKTFGFSVEDTTALLAQLTNAGFEASMAGTATRNILLNLADANGKLAQRLGEPVRTLPQLIDGLNKLRDEGIDLNETLQLTDKRSVAAFNTFIDTGDAALQMADDLRNASGSAKAMAKIMRDTLAGDTDIAISAIQGLVINIGEKLTPILRSIVKSFIFFIKNLSEFIKIIGIAGAGLLVYTLVTKGAAIAQRAYTLAVNIANAATKAFNVTVKANPLGLLLGILAAVTAAYFAFRDSTDAASKAQDEFSGKHRTFLEELAKEEAQLKTLFDAVSTANEGTRERTAAIEEINRLYGEYLPNLLTEKSTLEEIAVAQEIANKALIQDIAIKAKQAEITEANIKLIQAQKAAQEFVTSSTKENTKVTTAAFFDLLEQLDNVEKFFAKFQQDFDTELKRGEARNKLIKEFARSIGLNVGQIADFRDVMGTLRDANKEASDSIAETKTFYDQFIDALGLTKVSTEDIEKALRSLIKIQEVLLKQAKLLPESTEKELVIKNRKIKAIETEIKRLKSLGIEQGKQINLDKIRQQIDLARARNLEDELNRVKATEDTKFKIRKENLKKERDALIKQGGDKLQITELFENLITELSIESQRVRLEKLRTVRIKNEQDTNSDILKELETFFLEQGMTEEEIANQLLETKLVLLQKEIAVRKDIGAEIIDQELELARLRRKIADKEAEEQRKREEKLKEIRDFGIDEAIKALQKKADAAIKAADEEISATETQISKQEALAAQGLENSLKFEQEARAEALLAKIEAEKAKQRIEKLSAFWNIMANAASVQEGLTKFGIAEAASRVIPAFEEGGETPEKESIIRVSEKGSEYVVKHGPAQDYLPQLQAMNKGTYNDTFGGYIDNAKFVPNKLPVNDTNVQLLIVEMKGMRKEIKNLIPNMETVFDSTRQESINIYKYADRKRTVHLKVPRL